MIAPASLLGFGLAFAVVSWGASLVVGVIILAAQRRLRRGGPALARRAAELALVTPPIGSAVVALVLMGRSLLSAWRGETDHCLYAHDHAHLCLVHGSTWSNMPDAIIVLAAFGAVLVGGLTLSVVRLWTAARAVKRLVGVSKPLETRLEASSAPVFLVPGDGGFCFVAGTWSPRILVSAGAWERLDAGERRAMLAHEMAHIDQRDLRTRALLGVASLFGASFVAGRLLAIWSAATERLCDQRAARMAGAEQVASALVKLLRAGTPTDARVVAAFTEGPEEVVARIEALLSDGPSGRTSSRRLVACVAGVAVVAVAAAIVFAGPLHHAIETLLGVL
jgi:Zn-dependent protease with chaperone function